MDWSGPGFVAFFLFHFLLGVTAYLVRVPVDTLVLQVN
jgi:hypothetical protein